MSKSDHFGSMEVGIVAGGDITDKPNDQSGNQKVFLPMQHSSDGVKLDHLAFSTTMRSPTKHEQTSFPGVMDPGSLVYCWKKPGDNQVLILGQANDLANYENRSPGNSDLMGNPIMQELLKRKIKIMPPPDIEDGEERGVKIKKIKEKEEEWSHSMLKGLPTHGAMFSLAGFRLPENKDVPTAKQEFKKIMTQDMLKDLPGTAMSLGKMFKSMMGGKGGGGAGGGGSGGAGGGSGGGTSSSFPGVYNANGASVLSGLPPQLQNAVLSAAALTQVYETGESSSFSTSGRVEANVYMNNAVSLLSQITSVDDLMSTLDRLQYDESLFGLDQMNCVTYTIDTYWGKAIKTLCPDGNVTIAYANTSSEQAENSHNDSMGNASSAPGVTQDDNIFGKSSETMQKLLKRVAPEAEKKGNELSKKLNQGDIAKKLNEIVKKTVKGGNPLSPDLFSTS